MSCKWVTATPGKKFALTELGGEEYRVRDKYEDSNHNKRLYEQKVPENWVNHGWVKEIAR